MSICTCLHVYMLWCVHAKMAGCGILSIHVCNIIVIHTDTSRQCICSLSPCNSTIRASLARCLTTLILVLQQWAELTVIFFFVVEVTR